MLWGCESLLGLTELVSESNLAEAGTWGSEVGALKMYISHFFFFCIITYIYIKNNNPAGSGEFRPGAIEAQHSDCLSFELRPAGAFEGSLLAPAEMDLACNGLETSSEVLQSWS